MLLIPGRHVLRKPKICRRRGKESLWRGRGTHIHKELPPPAPPWGPALTCQLQLRVLWGTQEDVLWLEVQVGDVAVVEELQGAGWVGRQACGNLGARSPDPQNPWAGCPMELAWAPGQVPLPSCCRKMRATFSGRILRIRMKRERSPPAQNSMIR